MTPKDPIHNSFRNYDAITPRVITTSVLTELGRRMRYTMSLFTDVELSTDISDILKIRQHLFVPLGMMGSEGERCHVFGHRCTFLTYQILSNLRACCLVQASDSSLPVRGQRPGV